MDAEQEDDADNAVDSADEDASNEFLDVLSEPESLNDVMDELEDSTEV